jgi:hypothetical protein
MTQNTFRFQIWICFPSCSGKVLESSELSIELVFKLSTVNRFVYLYTIDNDKVVLQEMQNKANEDACKMEMFACYFL